MGQGTGIGVGQQKFMNSLLSEYSCSAKAEVALGWALSASLMTKGLMLYADTR